MVEFRNLQRKVRVGQRTIRELVERALEHEGEAGKDVSILLVDNAHIRNLNRKYRQVNRITDVLAFPMQEGEFSSVNPDLLGDIVISVERASSQAREFSQSLEREIAHLSIHGLLHLLGYRDEKKKDREKMSARVQEIMEIMGRS